MVRRVLALGLLLALGCLGVSCGGSSTATPASPTGVSGAGTLYFVLGDTPACDVLALRLDVSQLTLNVANSTNTVGVLGSTSTLINFDLAALRNSETILAVRPTQAGTFNKFSVGLTALTMYVYNPANDPPIGILTESLTTGSPPVKYNVSPPLKIDNLGVSVLSLDFDLQHVVQLDSQGNITGFVDPVATASAPTSSTVNGFGTMDGIEGFVTTVNTTGFVSGSTTFTGGVSLQLLANPISSVAGPGVTVDLTKATALCAEPVPPASPQSNQACSAIPLDTILTDSYATADAYIDKNGNLTATTLTIGPQEFPANNLVAFIGPVLSVTRGSDGNVTGFTMFLRDAQPPASGVNLDTAVTVSLAPGTIYNTYPPAPQPGATIPATNFAALPFGASAIAPGEQVVVHGVYTIPTPATPPAVTPLVSTAANEVDLKTQTQEGNFGTLLAVQPDDVTGAFTLSPCATLFQQGDAPALPIYVFTSPATSFVHLPGLTSLRSQPPVMVKGLLFYETESVTINGVTVPAGKLVMLAKAVVQSS
ncbi:MAG TPA: DUF4382 domain-containing protein [Terriglobia bacterium]|nr:DUF4382 domain-containing protein [Terriglobia bacterium]